MYEREEYLLKVMAEQKEEMWVGPQWYAAAAEATVADWPEVEEWGIAV